MFHNATKEPERSAELTAPDPALLNLAFSDLTETSPAWQELQVWTEAARAQVTRVVLAGNRSLSISLRNPRQPLLQLPNLTRLDLSNTQLVDAVFLRNLFELNRIVALDLSRVSHGVSLPSALVNCTSLTSLVVSQCGLGTADEQILAAFVSSPLCRLRELSVSHNRGLRGAPQLMESLEMSRVESFGAINLGFCSWLPRILPCLLRSRCLTRLDLRSLIAPRESNHPEKWIAEAMDAIWYVCGS